MSSTPPRASVSATYDHAPPLKEEEHPRVHNSGECFITHVDVFLGSLTFTSEQLACSLAVRSKDRGAQVTIQSLAEFKPEHIDSTAVPFRVAVFVISTHAAGKPAPNAEQFLLWLRKTSEANHTTTKNPRQSEDDATKVSPPPHAPIDSHTRMFTPSTRHLSLTSSPPASEAPGRSTQAAKSNFHVNWRLPFGGAKASKVECEPTGVLHGFQYAVFGVGNSIYRSYNSAAKYVDRALKSLGAVRVCALGLGDISKDIDEEFTNWENELLRLVSGQCGTSSHAPGTPERKPIQPLSRNSPPGAPSSANSKICVDEVEDKQMVTRGPTTADLEMFIGPVEQQQKRMRQRRHSSATTMILSRRGNFGNNAPVEVMPPLTDRS